MFCRKQRHLLIGVLLALVATGPAVAQTAAQQIFGSNEQMAVLSARLNELEIKSKIAEKEDEMRKRGGTSQPGLGADNEGLPVVRAIEGVDGRLRATLMMPNRNGLQSVAEGEKFGVWTVKKISINAVYMSRNNENIRLSFGTAPENQTASGAGQALSAAGSPYGGFGAMPLGRPPGSKMAVPSPSGR